MATVETLRLSPFGPGNSERSYSAGRPASALRAVEREMLRSTLSSRYIRRIRELESLLERTKALSELEQNWDSYGAMPPNNKAVGAALRFLHLVPGEDILPAQPLPSAEGGVAFRFVADDKRALVEFLNSGTIEVMLYDKSGTLSPTVEGQGGVEEILQAVNAHLKR